MQPGAESRPARTSSRRVIERAMPALRILRSYRRGWLAGDLVAGLAVCVLSIPMSIACAGMIGVEPQRGLVAAVIGLFAYGLVSRSGTVVVGPDTSVSIVVAAALGNVAAATGDLARTASLAALVALLAGAIMLLMAAARLGAVADLLSRPVLVGFLNGAALIVVFSQIGKLLGMELASKSFFGVVQEVAARVDEVRWGTTATVLSVVAAVVALSRVLPRVPWTLVVFSLGIVASFTFDLDRRGVAVVGALPRALPHPVLLDITLQDVAALLPAAISVALLTFPEAILLGRAFGKPGQTDVGPSRELLALGLSNVVCGAASSFPVAASSTRTSLNRALGANTQVAQLFAACFLAVSMTFLGRVIGRLPVVALAAILVYAGVRLFDVATVRALWRASWKSGVIAVLTTLGVLLVGIVPGILVGVLMSLAVVVHHVSRPADAVLRRVEGRKGMHDVEEGEGTLVPGLVAYRFYAPLVFSNVGRFVERVRTLVTAAQPPARCFLLDAQAISDVDVTAAEQVRALAAELAERGVRFEIANANRPLREKIARYRLNDVVGAENVNRSVNNALKDFLAAGTDERDR